MIQRSGQVVIRMLNNVRQPTIKPFITQHIAPNTLIYTDEYTIYNRLVEWGYRHKTVTTLLVNIREMKTVTDSMKFT